MAAGLFMLLAACQHQALELDSGLAGFDINLIENQRAICDRKDGRFGRGGLAGSFVCYLNTRDANQRCSAGSDCQGLCLARSRTCAPVTPLFGCQQVLTNSGVQATVCIE